MSPRRGPYNIPASGAVRLLISEAGTAELTFNGRTLWASDTDPDFIEELGEDVLEPNGDIDDDTVGEILDYLVEFGFLTDAQANDALVVFPELGETIDVPDDDDDGEEYDDDDDD